MTVYGDVPRPRVLFEDVPPEIFERMSDLAPTLLEVSSEEAVHDSDWDLLVTFASQITDRSKSLHVLSFGATYLTPAYTRGNAHVSASYLSRDTVSGARTSRVREAASKDIRRLLARSLAPNIDVAAEKDVWRARSGLLDSNSTQPEMVPWLSLGEEEAVYAFEWTRAHGRGLWWVLPEETTNHRDWLSLMLKHLQTVDPNAVPADPDWRRQAEWAPPGLAKALSDLERVEEAREAAAIEFDRQEAEANLSIDVELKNAEVNEHVLLTGTGEPLVEQVAHAFRAVGFDVQDMDENHVSKSGARLEDLRLTVSGVVDWMCLVEVKGWAGGVQVRDVSQIVGRPAIQFVLDEQREPDKVLLVANQHRNDPPASRPVPPVQSPERDLAPLEQFDGAFIDTRDLFRAVRAIAAGDVKADEVRDSIVHATGVWSWPTVETETALRDLA